ncbi:hypothetical protein EV138_5310 [Kribbella voronezhensis]|uniref:Uncharacterized protein n=1 Tax=Kribbella voronezhensis TaxID=2512212 RepID=A0A4R7TID1_9ACTN|nr:hypothetical protein EV138_5310 [Kribbella voronezhensis]
MSHHSTPARTTRSRASRVTRRIVGSGLIGAATVTAVVASPASAAGLDPRSGVHQAPPSTQQRACTLDGFVIDRLPGGIGSPSDFEYEWEEVAFHSRVWETGPDPEGATVVDLTVKTIRGMKLTDLSELRDFLTEYHEQDPDEWKLTPVKVGEYDGYLATDHVFYFVSPGLAAEVSIDRSRFSEDDLLTTAAGFHPETSSS